VSGEHDRGRPAVFARLRADAERQLQRRTPGPVVRWAGWVIAGVVVALVVVLALRAAP
jgi:hypothetical protein